MFRCTKAEGRSKMIRERNGHRCSAPGKRSFSALRNGDLLSFAILRTRNQVGKLLASESLSAHLINSRTGLIGLPRDDSAPRAEGSLNLYAAKYILVIIRELRSRAVNKNNVEISGDFASN